MPPRPPPMLQQMPQRIQPRPFQSMMAQQPPPRAQRPRAFPMKRNIRLPGPQEITPPKVRRVEPPIQPRQQIIQQNAVSIAAKIPSGITVTPPKKTVEANKAANVLAARGKPLLSIFRFFAHEKQCNLSQKKKAAKKIV